MLQGNGLEVLGSDAFAVVLHFDGVQTLGFEADFDVGGTRVQAVLHQFFDHRLQIDDDLAGLDLMDATVFDGLDGGHISGKSTHRGC